MKAIQMKRLIESVQLILDTMEETNHPEIWGILERMYADGDTAIRRLDLILERQRYSKAAMSPKKESNED